MLDGSLFLACALVIAAAGKTLIDSVDAIAERTGLGRAFLGMVLVAAITSLPELSTGIAAVTVADSPDIAVGDIVGSCVFNLVLFVAADLIARRHAFYANLRRTHTLTAAFGILLAGMLALAILPPEIEGFAIGHVGIFSIALAVGYVGCARMVYATDHGAPSEPSPKRQMMSLRSAVIRCGLAGVAVAAAGTGIALLADRIAERAGLSEAFVGVLFVACATSLPEVVSTFGAIRLRAYDLAVGNLLGSNLANMVVLFADDLFYVKGPLLAAASDDHAITAVIAMCMTAVVIAAITYERHGKSRIVDLWANLSLGALFAFNVWLMFESGQR